MRASSPVSAIEIISWPVLQARSWVTKPVDAQASVEIGISDDRY